MIGKKIIFSAKNKQLQLFKNYTSVAIKAVNNENFDIAAAKSFKEIPRLSRVRMIIDHLPGGRFYNVGLNEMHRLLRHEYGNIIVMPGMLGKPEIVFSYSDVDNQTILLNEGTWPNRYSFEILKYFREKLRPDVYGGEYGSVASENGEKWYKMRTLINQAMLPPKNVQEYVRPMDEISRDFEKFLQARNNEISGNDVNYWSLESIAYITLNKRLGLFEEEIRDERTRELIQLVRRFFILTVSFELQPSIWKYYHTKAFKEYMDVNNRLININMSFVEESLAAMKSSSSESTRKGGILHKLMEKDKRVAVIMAIDALLAGIDTTASASIGILYCLAKNPEKQEKLRKEILELFPNKSEPIDEKKMATMPYLRSCIKEGLRLYPPVSGSSRRTQKDLVLSGYHIPIGTNVVVWPQLFYRNEKCFPNSNEYIPERWMKDECPHLQSNKFHFLPFGHGVRACVGKRIANMEMEVLLINLLRSFRIEWHQDDLKVNSVLVNIPVGDIRFKLVKI